MKILSLFSFVLMTLASFGQSAFMVPQTSLPSATRIQNVSNLVTSLQYGVVAAAVPETYPIFTNFVMRARSQTISGANTFSGANVFSNSAQVFTLGKIDTSYITNSPRIAGTIGYFGTSGGTADSLRLTGPVTLTNAYPYNYFKFHDVSGALDEKNFKIDHGNGALSLNTVTDDGVTTTTLFSIGPLGATFSVPITANVTMKDTLLTNVVTTNSIIGATAVYVNGTMGTTNGNVGVTNNASHIIQYDTGGTADDKITKLIADSDAWAVKFYNDAGTLISTPINISRTAGVAQTMSVAALLDVTGNIQSTADYLGQGNISTEGIIVAGTSGFTAPTSATGGFYAFDSTAPSADPLTGAYFWSESGVAKYRTSTSSEGSGGDNRIHNRTATTSGAGTDYSFTTSTAAIDFGTTDPSVTIPTAGTYLFLADVRFTNGATAADEYRFKLRNTTSATDVVSDAVITCAAATQIQHVTLQGTMTCAASDVVTIYGFNNSAARGTANSAGTRLRYVRLY